MDPARGLRLFIDHLDLARSGDSAGLAAIYDPDVDYYDPIGGPRRGRDAVVPYLIGLCSLYDRLELDIRNTWIHNDRTAVEWAQTSERDGRSGTTRGMTVLSVRGGVLSEHRDFMNLGRPGWADALRAEVESRPSR